MTATHIPPRPSPSLAACLGAAQSEAERLYGQGPVPRWQPAFDRRPWIAAGVVLAMAVASTAVWLWDGAAPPQAGVSAPAEPVEKEPTVVKNAKAMSLHGPGGEIAIGQSGLGHGPRSRG